MAEQKKSLLVTVETLLENYADTGLDVESDGYEAFVQYCKSEYGEIAGENIETFAGIKLSGKGDKAKGSLNRGTVKFAQCHNTATRVLSGCSLIKGLEDSTGSLVGKLNCRELVSLWHEGWQRKQDAKRREATAQASV